MLRGKMTAILKENMKHISMIVLLMLAFGSTQLNAQVQDETTPGFDFGAPDSTAIDSAASASEEGDGAPGPGVVSKPYERIVLYVDSATNLITYYGVMEQEESGSDSLYIRAKRWAAKTFGKEIKVEVDKRNQKLTYIGRIPAYAYINKYSKRPLGIFEFKMTFLIKEGRYKYMITNLVHESVKPADGSKTNRNYFEYYYTSTTKIRENDTVLRMADRDINKMIDRMIAALKDPILVDEDDW
jgi:hypothetical protein